jgi:hypothetical protein
MGNVETDSRRGARGTAGWRLLRQRRGRVDRGAANAICLWPRTSVTRTSWECRATANEVGYPVPCPTRVPEGLAATPGIDGCQLDIIGPGGVGPCGRAWRGWVVGSSETNDQHLVVVASPRALRNEAKVVNGPAWYPSARVRPLRSLTVDGSRMRAVYVPVKTNAGSAFMRHVVLIWTVGGHTYGVGFHKVQGVRPTLDLDKALARGIRLVAPADSQ